MWFLTEDGLYEVLMQSTKPIAKSFKKEVKKILKELRIKGYLPPPDNPEMVSIYRSEYDILQLIAEYQRGVNFGIEDCYRCFRKVIKLTHNEVIFLDCLLESVVNYCKIGRSWSPPKHLS